MRRKISGLILGVLGGMTLLHSTSCESAGKERHDGQSFSEAETLQSSHGFAVDGLEPLAYKSYVESSDNGLRLDKKIGGFTFSAMYKPHDYLALLDLEKDSINKQAVLNKMEEYEGMQYFTYRITADNKNEELLQVDLGTEEEYYTRIEYFSFNMQKDIKLLDGKDTLDCALFHFERVYGLAPYASFVLGFPYTKKEELAQKKGKPYLSNNKTITYNDRVFGSGIVNITIRKEDINNIPQLIIR